MTLPTLRVSLGGLVLVFFLGALATSLSAQETSGPVPPASPATIKGTVRDIQGVAVPGAHVVLVLPDSTGNREAISNNTGSFAFTDLAPGTYDVEVKGQAVGRSGSVSVVLGSGQQREVTLITTGLPMQTTTVNVNATLRQVAQAQVQQQEEQRVLGFFPNYYTSYLWDAAPMTPKLKFKLAFRTLWDPVTFLGTAATAGAEQYHHTFPGYGLGAQGYGKRFGATYADTVSSRMLGSAVFPALLHQDPRYFYQGSGSVRSRVLYALVSAVICRRDDGQLEPNYSHILGSFTAAGLSNLYRAPQDRQAGLTIRNGFIIIAGSAVENVLREFLSRKLTPNVPAFANGKASANPSKAP